MFINWDVTARFDPNSLVPSTHGIPIPSYGNYGGPNYTAGVEGGELQAFVASIRLQSVARGRMVTRGVSATRRPNPRIRTCAAWRGCWPEHGRCRRPGPTTSPPRFAPCSG